MAKSDPTRPGGHHVHPGKEDVAPEQPGPQLKDPRSVAAIDNMGVDDQADLLDVVLDEQPGDRDADGRSFADDVRSDAPNGAIRESGED